MKSVQEELGFFESLMKGVSTLFGNSCEIVLHDLSGGYDSTIVMIENGHVTGRKIGDCGSNLGLEVLRGTVEGGDKYGYISNSPGGNMLRSSSMYIRNTEGRVVGCLCINMDISRLMVAENAIRELTTNDAPHEEEFFVNDVSDLLDLFLQKVLDEIGKPVAYMNREEKIRAIRYLDSKGAMLISKAGDRICNFFNISKFTLYSYLDEANELREKIEE
jgi:predicted transcriptional regulator YheO